MADRTQEIIKLQNDYKTQTGKDAKNSQGNFTKGFNKFNLKQLKSGETTIIAKSENKLYNKFTNRLVNKSSFYTKKGELRQKFKNDPLFGVDGQRVITGNKYINKIKPIIMKAEQDKVNKDIKIDFTMLNNKLENLLNILKPTTIRYLLTTEDGSGNKQIYTLNASTIQKLKNIISQGEVITEEIDIDSFTTIVVSWLLRRPFTLTILGKPPESTQPTGAFFSYTHNLEKVDLSRYGVYTEEQEKHDDKIYDINCICHALQEYGLDITPIKHLVRNRNIPQKDLKIVAETLKIYISLKYIKDEKKKNHYGDRTLPEIRIGNINDHYFLIEKTNNTSYSIENYHDIHEIEGYNMIYKKYNGSYKKSKDRFIDSYKLIKMLYNDKDKYLKEIKYHHNLYKSVYHEKICEFGSLSYDENVNTLLNEPRNGDDKEIIETYFFDYETTTRKLKDESTIHKPYCVYTDKHRDGFWGENCGKYLLNDLCDKHGVSTKSDDYKDVLKFKKCVKLIAHNAGYDFRFLMKHLFYGVDTIEKNNGLMSGKAYHYFRDKVIALDIRDSLKLINMPLKKFGACFNLDVEKEIMPYDLYTEEAVYNRYIPLKFCLKYVSDDDYKQFMYNLERWSCIYTNDKGKKMVDIHKYAGEYCYMDCVTLRDGFNTFKKLVYDATAQDINNYISLASMSNDYLLLKGCYEDVYKVSGVPRHFIQKCVVGGRCMTARNEKIIKRDCKISDFDAVSLYPSAMKRMRGFLKGKPKVITDFRPELYDGYFIYIQVTNIKKAYDFPLASVLTDKGIRHFKNDLIGEFIYCDRTMLEDLITFCGLEYDFIKGYYYDEGFNTKINETMEHLFKQRLKYKKLKNPIQMVFKELMNSSYGKTFMKPIDSDKEYIAVKDLQKFIDYHYNNVKSIVLCDNKKLYRVEKIKSIDTHFNNVHCGVEILSMSKRIMNEVMCLADDNNFNMYITDTDSIHIDTDKVPLLGDLFKNKYSRDLIGKGMGQFHTDFEMEGNIDDPISTDAVFLGKKCYCDKLLAHDKDGNEIYDYHYRMKGVPSDCIKHKADTEYGGDIIKLYEDLYYNEDGLEFNLLACRPKFEYHKNMTISSKSKFMRRVKF